MILRPKPDDDLRPAKDCRCPRCGQDRPAFMDMTENSDPDRLPDLVIRCPHCGEFRIATSRADGRITAWIDGTDEPYEGDRQVWEARKHADELLNRDGPLTVDLALDAATALHLLGNCYMNTARNVECLETGERLLTVLSPFVDSSADAAELYLRQLLSMGSLIDNVKEDGGGLDYYRRAVAAGRGQTGPAYAEALSAYALALILTDGSRTEEAIACARKAVALTEQYDRKDLMAADRSIISFANEVLYHALDLGGEPAAGRPFLVQAVAAEEDNLRCGRPTEEELSYLTGLYGDLIATAGSDEEELELCRTAARFLRDYQDTAPLPYCKMQSKVYDRLSDEEYIMPATITGTEKLIGLLESRTDSEGKDLLIHNLVRLASIWQILGNDPDADRYLRRSFDLEYADVKAGLTEPGEDLLLIAWSFWQRLQATDRPAARKLLRQLKEVGISKNDLKQTANQVLNGLDGCKD